MHEHQKINAALVQSEKVDFTETEWNRGYQTGGTAEEVGQWVNVRVDRAELWGSLV